jgi:nucleotide-binding universal stress UspA family protein
MKVEAVTRSWWAVGARKALAQLSPLETARKALPKSAHVSHPAPKGSQPAQASFRSDFTRRPQESDKCGEWPGLGGHEPVRLLVPFDFSASSLCAWDCALRMAQQAKVHITLLHSIEINLDPYGPVNVGLIKEEMRQTAAARISQIATLAKQQNISADYVIEEGAPPAVIEAYTQEHPVNLVILALPEHRGLKWLIGRKTAEKMVRQINCPVLVLHY